METSRLQQDAPSAFDWPAGIGATVVLSALVAIGLVAAGGWTWFAGFLAGSASGWVQAFGSIGAIVFGFLYVDRQNRHQLERDERLARGSDLRQVYAVIAASDQAEEAVSWTDIGARLDTIEGILDPLELAAEEALSTLKGIPLSEIPDQELLKSCGQLRKDLVTLQIHCKAQRQQKVMYSAYLRDVLPQISENLAKTRRQAADVARRLMAD